MNRGLAVIIALSLTVLSCSGGGGTPPPASPAPAAAASPATPPLASAEPGAPPEIDRVTPLPKPLPEIAGKVNGKPIPLHSVRMIVNQAARQGGGGAGAEDPYAYRQALQQTIVRELLAQEAVRRKIAADDARVEQAYNEARVQFKDDKAWAAMLQGVGMDPQTFRNELRVFHTIQALLSQVAAEAPVQVTDQDAQAFYDTHPAAFQAGERVKASHILIRIPEGATPERKEEARKKAEALLQRVRAREDFAALARQSSEDPGSAQNGGDLGTFGRGQMVPPFEQAAFALKAGEVSGVVETPFGFHIIKVDQHSPTRKLAFPEVKERLKAEMVQQKRQQAQQSFVNSLRAKAKIETFL
jgi:peptidyl-prolyl cis-trans isomerase C